MTTFRRSVAILSAILLLAATCSCGKKEQTADDPITDNPADITETGDIENNETENDETENNQDENNENINTDESKKQEDKEDQQDEIPVVVEPVNPFANETLESFYDNAAFVGDSVMHGLQLYSARGVTATTNSTFLTLSSFAARHALSDVTEKSYHPLYEGVKMKTEDALVLANVDKVFVSLGLNDVRVTPRTYYENYIEFLGKIKEKRPDIKIFIVSTTYPVEAPNPNKMDRATALDYRNQLHDLNTRLYTWCKENDAYFVDVMSPLIDENGFLAKEYTSDNYVHLTNKAYTIWEQTLIDFATTLIETGSPVDSFPAIPVYVTEEPEVDQPAEATETSTTPTNQVVAPTNENSTEVTQ